MAITLQELAGLHPTATALETRTALQALTIQELLDAAQTAAESGMRSTAAAAYRWIWRIILPSPWDIVPTENGMGYMAMFGGGMLCMEVVQHPTGLADAWSRADSFLEEWFFEAYPLPMDGYPLDAYEAVAA